ncbi:hypothetical protein C5167_046029 [Papaver somniferum]|uniref:Uncharacterized protein n=1 Tax=Papaver somniferum TaxID=3469 RepID=A0A4Y7LCN8_PAPSO|nr:hypothetical protein C5167_046029 [Papaver somniferum]
MKSSSEKTKWGSTLSGAVVSTLVGLTASNVGIISFEAPTYSVVMEYLLPLAVPLLLFKADLRQVVHSTGALLFAFLLGSGHTCRYLFVCFFVYFMLIKLHFGEFFSTN